MGDMFRSEEMALIQMFIQPEAAYASVAELGESGCVQFRDLNPDVNAFQRKFVSEVRRCDELSRRIRYIENEMKKDEIQMPVLTKEEPTAPNPRQIIDLEAHLESIENELRELADNGMNLNNNNQEMSELKLVLENTEGFFSSSEVINFDTNRQMEAMDSKDPKAQGQGAQRGQLGFIAGVIKLERFFAFEKMLWRISRGNIFLKRSDITGLTKDFETGGPTLKTVFVAFFQGDQLKQRIKKVCTGFHASVYPCPSSHGERQEMIKDVKTRLEDLKTVLNQTADHRNRVLVAASRNLPAWSVMVKKMKAIYHTLNYFNVDVSNKCLIGEGWVAVRELPIIQTALAVGSKTVDSTIPSFLNVIETHEQPPTYTRTNKFTRGFQNLIEAYGMASYREVNPALYTCITFPFLFAVMFGDLGHGLILVMFALWMVLSEKKLEGKKGEIFNIFFGGRYIILLMGLFSVYTGFIYNDVFSKSMNIFGSKWRVNYEEQVVFSNSYLTLNPSDDVNGVYTMGVDPIWQLADNKIIFLNTYKMKLSIIFGVLHMIFGVCMSLINFTYFRQWSRIFLEFIPQVLFLILLFGYMVFMMFYKWVKYTAKTDVTALTPGCAPSILILFINMMLFKHQEPLPDCEEYMFEEQQLLQTIFVVIALICIPWMLFGTPIFILIKRMTSGINELPVVVQEKRKTDGTIEMATVAANNVAVSGGNSDSHGAGHGHENEPMGEVFIQQAIHTIEYVLSTISHTASYLRLWALSLAHAQLSEVLWSMVLHNGFAFPGYICVPILFIVFAVWGVLTVGILVLIEGLSAFLHTLRLHWVEFMSKFYVGLGYAFTPFSFKTILESEEDEVTALKAN